MADATLVTEAGYKYPDVFPNELFVKRSVARHFASLGFERMGGGYTDYVCYSHNSSERWHIEAKGQSQSMTTDFHTGLGQLVHRMTDGSHMYALAVPDTSTFLRLCREVQPWVREQLRLHWLLVGADREVRVVGPDDKL